MIDAANGTGIEAGIRTRVLPTNSISTTGSAHTASFAALAEVASGGAINTWAKPSLRANCCLQRDLIGTDLSAARHVSDNRTRLQARRDNRALLFVAPPPPTLRAGDYLNSRHRTVANTGANTVACTDASNSPNRRCSARRPSPESYEAGDLAGELPLTSGEWSFVFRQSDGKVCPTGAIRGKALIG